MNIPFEVMLVPTGCLHFSSLLHWERESRASDRWEILVHQMSLGLPTVKTCDLQFQGLFNKINVVNKLFLSLQPLGENK